MVFRISRPGLRASNSPPPQRQPLFYMRSERGGVPAAQDTRDENAYDVRVGRVLSVGCRCRVKGVGVG